MTPKEYEQYIASIFQNQGYKTLVTPYSNDWGIDVIAIKGKEKIAIQAKMYGNKRKVNRAAIMQLYGAMAYQDCTKAVIATDGELLDDAISVAKKLKIEILTTKTNFVSTFHKEKEEENSDSIHKDFRMEYPTFDEVWRKYIMPLKGVTLWNTKGENKILDVNWGGITRIKMFIWHRTHTGTNSFCFHSKKSNFIGNLKIVDISHKTERLLFQINTPTK